MLTLTQKKLLKLLAHNSRFSNKDLAKAIGVSPDTVDYQIRNLIEKQQLGHLGALFDYTYFGFIDHHYLLRLKDISKISFEEVRKLPFVIFANTSFGSYDLQIIFVARSEKEAQEYFEKIDNVFKDQIIDTLTFTSNFTYKYTSVLPEFDVEVNLPKNKKQTTYTATTNSYTFKYGVQKSIDETDIKLIHFLIADARATYLDMAKKLDVSRELIRRRVEKFVETKLLSAFAFKPHYDKFEYYSNFILLKFANVSQKDIQQYVDSVPEIFYAGRTIGTYSAIVYTVTKSPADFVRVVKELKLRFKEHLLDAQLFYFDKVIKQTQFPGIELFEDKK